jgi:hypothetical protein
MGGDCARECAHSGALHPMFGKMRRQQWNFAFRELERTPPPGALRCAQVRSSLRAPRIVPQGDSQLAIADVGMASCFAMAGSNAIPAPIASSPRQRCGWMVVFLNGRGFPRGGSQSPS